MVGFPVVYFNRCLCLIHRDCFSVHWGCLLLESLVVFGSNVRGLQTSGVLACRAREKHGPYIIGKASLMTRTRVGEKREGVGSTENSEKWYLKQISLTRLAHMCVRRISH